MTDSSSQSSASHFVSQCGVLWLRAVTAYPVVSLLLCALVLLAGFAGVTRFKLDASTDALLLETDPALREYRETVQEYGFGDFLIVTVEEQQGLFRPEAIANIQAMVADLAQIPRVERVLSLLDAVVLPSEVVPLGEVLESIKNLTDADVDLAQAREQLIASPVFKDLLIDAQGRMTAIQIDLQPFDTNYSFLIDERYRILDELDAPTEHSNPDVLHRKLDETNVAIAASNEKSLQEQQELVARIRQVIDSYRSAERTVHLGGPAMIIVDMVESIRQDMVVFGLAAALLFLVVLGVFFRRPVWVLLPVLISISVVFFMTGLLGWMDWKVTVISSNFAALLMILAVSLSVHLMVRHRELSALMPSSSSRDLAIETCRQMFVPCFYAALTTLVAFGSLLISGIRPVIEFGKMMGVGMCVALVLSFTLAPAALALLGRGKSGPQTDWTQVFTNQLANAAARYGKWVLAVAVVLAVGAIAGTIKLQVDNRFIDYFKEDTEIYQGMLAIDTRLGGTVPFDVVLKAPEVSIVTDRSGFADVQENAFDDLDFLDELDASLSTDAGATSGFWYNRFGLERLRNVHRALENTEGIGKVLSLASMLDLAEEMKGGQPLSNLELAVLRQYIPDDLAQVLFDPYLSQDGNQVRLQARVVESTPELKRDDLIQSLHRSLQQQGFSTDEYQIVGAAVLYNNMLQSLYTSQVQTLGLVFLVVGLMLLILFRSFKVAILGLVPNILAAGVVLGTLGLSGIPLDLVTVTVASISVGIAVDNAIHYLYRYRLEYQRKADAVGAIYASHRTVGQGIYYTSFSIIAGFLVFTLSNFNPTVYFGMFTALAMLMALLGSLTLLPRLLAIVKPFKG
ncbi:MAG: efflux RND transporter permease subunit [Gammaproteobacteria bacterium]